jgi:hypothetical protein
MITRQSPDLVPPEISGASEAADGQPDVRLHPGGTVEFLEKGQTADIGKTPLKDAGCNTSTGGAAPLIFWPRVRPGIPGKAAGDVEFKWRLDADATPITSPLLFVENSAVSVEGTVKRIAEHYRNLKGAQESLRTASLGGLRRRYAPARDEGDTSFDTDSWLLSTRGRLLTPQDAAAADPQENYLMDGRMEGADQPPFYPVVQEARVQIQTIDRLLGAPQGLIRVGFYRGYVRNGFEPANPSEIFLHVIGPDIELNLTGRGAASGGVAKPSALVAALSRKVGLIGGTSPRRETRLIDQPPYDFRKAEGGGFDPKEFFGQLDAKLLGLISLKDVIAATTSITDAPKLVETIGYNVLGGETVERARQRILALLTEYIGDGNNKGRLQRFIDDAFAQFSSSTQAQQLKELYPRLFAQINTFKDTLDAATKEIRSQPTAQLNQPLTRIVMAGRALVAEVNRTLENPVPEKIERRLTALNGAWQQLKTTITDRYLTIGQTFHSQAAALVIEKVCDEVTKTPLGGVLLGLDPDVTCQFVIQNPGDAAARVSTSLFNQVFGDALIAILAKTRDLQAETTGRIAWARLRLKHAAAAALAALVKTLEPVLDRDAPILKAEVQAGVINTLVSALEGKVDAAITGAAVKGLADVLPVLDRIAKVPPSFQEAAMAAFQAADFKGHADEAALRAQFKALIVDPAVQAATSSVQREVDRIRDLVLRRMQQARAQAITDLMELASALVKSVATSAEFAQIVNAARTINGWCEAAASSANTVLNVAIDLSDRLMSGGTQLTASIAKIVANANQLTLPPETPADVRRQFDAAVARLKMALQSSARLLGQIETARGELRDLQSLTGNVCADVAKFLDPARRVFELRREAVVGIQQLAAELATIDRLVRSLRLPPATEAPGVAARVAPAPRREASSFQPVITAIAAIRDECRLLFAGITSIAKVGISTEWAELRTRLDALLNHTPVPPVPAFAAHRQALEEALTQLRTAAIDLRSRLQNADPATLEEIGREIISFAIERDKRLAALALQTTAMSDTLAAMLESQAAAAIRQVATTLEAPHTAVADAFQILIDVFSDPIVELLVNPKVVAQFRAARAQITTDATDLQRIAKTPASDPRAVLAASAALVTRWRQAPPPLVESVRALADLVDHVLRGDLGAIIDVAAIRLAIEGLARELRALLLEMIPTSVDLRYSWQTAVGASDFFKMKSSTPKDLTLDAAVSINFVTGTRLARVQGHLEPFQVHLLGSSLDIATIHFNQASFESVNGSAPSFQIGIDNVEVGAMLTFLKPLQDWLSPGSGLYIRPLTDHPGIMAGYAYDAGIISLGALSFLNVALDVRAELPFTNEPARFKFFFASPKRPFLITSPPYGGGGYLSLDCDAGGIRGFSVSFMFGAVVAIKFGPLEAHGRVTAGIYIIQEAGGGRVVGALIEAVGEGHIACFGISVCFQVGLEDRNGTLKGFSSFSFEFKVGFATISYGVRAAYNVKNSRGAGGALPSGEAPGARANLEAADRSAADAFYICDVPLKGKAWSSYQKRLAMELL